MEDNTIKTEENKTWEDSQKVSHDCMIIDILSAGKIFLPRLLCCICGLCMCITVNICHFRAQSRKIKVSETSDSMST